MNQRSRGGGGERRERNDGGGGRDRSIMIDHDI